MQEEKYYNVRMRASQNENHGHGGKYISGGELLSTYDNLKYAVNVLLEKGLNHSRGKPDFMQIQLEFMTEPTKLIKPLKIVTNEVETVEKGRSLAKKFLEKVGVPKESIEKAYKQITDTSGIRGAMLIDVHSGERIDNRNEKGVRVSRMDWSEANFERWADHHQISQNSRMKEALVLATKVCGHSATIAELCWSDDPDYVTGYVASKKQGYQRITRLKEYGDERGCRIFFVDCLGDLNTYIHYLEKQTVLVEWEEEDDAKIN